MKPRIILADTDTGYIEPIHIRLAEMFGNAVEFEVITDPAWFVHLFEHCQEAALLVISENLYGVSIGRHSIRRTVVLSDRVSQTERVSADVYRMNRYQTIMELFAEIVALGDLSGIIDGRKGTCTVAVSSAAGGDGKTTVSLNLAAALAHNGQRVLYISACRLQTFQRFLEDPSPVVDSGFYLRLSGKEEVYPTVKKQLRQEQFFYLPPFRGLLSSFGLDYSVYRRIAESAAKSGEFDYIILDTDSSADELFGLLQGVADKVILVTGQTETSGFALKQLMNAMTREEAEKLLLVRNYVSSEEESGTADMLYGFRVRENIEYIAEMDRMKLKDLPAGNGCRRLAIQIS